MLLNRHDGTFEPPVSYLAGVYATGLATADLNGDGAPDMAVTAYHSGTLDVLLNDGHGKLSAPVAYDAGGAGISGLLAVDLNGDQRPDLVTFTPSEARVLLAEGQGNFAAPAHYAVGQYNQGLNALDLNRDGHLDLVLSDTPAGVVRVLSNDGSGKFAAAASYPADPDPSSVTSSDLNADGWPDLVIGHQDYVYDYVSVLFSMSDGSLAPPLRYRAGGTENAVITSADLDANGRLDLVVANGNRDQVSVLLNSCRPK